MNKMALKPINGNKKKASSKQKKLSPRERLIKKLCAELECNNPKTELAVAMYAKECYEQIDDELDDIANSQTMLDCVIVASRFYEEELIDLEGISENPSFQDFDIDTFRDNEGAILSIMDYCLYLRD